MVFGALPRMICQTLGHTERTIYIRAAAQRDAQSYGGGAKSELHKSSQSVGRSRRQRPPLDELPGAGPLTGRRLQGSPEEGGDRADRRAGAEPTVLQCRFGRMKPKCMSLETVPVGTESEELCKRIVRNAEEMSEQGLDKDAAGNVLECIRWPLTKRASSNTLEPVVCTPTVKPGANDGKEQKGGEGGAMSV